MAEPPLLVAHRAGNRPETAMAVADRADAVELDVHVFRGRVEVRHEKVLRPTARLWERWELFPADTPVATIDEVLAAVEPDLPLLVDLKCFTRRAARRIRRSLPGDRELIVSSRSWWILSAFADRPRTTLLRSCGNRWQVRLVTRVPGLGQRVGVVVHQRLLDRAVVAGLAARTPHVFTWAVATPERARELVAAGVTGLIVDDLDLAWPRGDAGSGERFG